MMKKKRKAVRAGLIAFSAATVFSAATSTAAAVNIVPQDTVDKWYNEYLQRDYAFDIKLLEEYINEYASIPVAESASSIMARSRNIVSDTNVNSEIIDYINANYDNLGIANVDTTLNVRSNPVSGEIIGKLLPDSACEIEETTEEGWYKITSGDVTGYVSGEYILTGDLATTRAEETIQLNVVVDVNGLNFRKGATTTSKVMKVLPRNTMAEVIEDNGEWLKISYNGTEGYVYGEHVVMQYDLPVAMTIDEYNATKKPAVSSIRTQLVEYAKQFVGYPYVYGGNSLTKGTDCSGFVKLIMAKFGITTPRTATTQYNAGKKISVAELLPGDLIVYGDRVIEHIGIYIGNGQIVHASNKKTGIKYSDYNYRKIYGCVRFIED